MTCTAQRAASLLAWGLAIVAQVGRARADAGLEHVVRPGETLASIAEQYYGDPRRESVLVAENGLTSEGGSVIVVGLRLRVPTVSYHRVAEGETWAAIASRHYGDAARAFALIENNGASSGVQPDPGAEILVPYPLRHVAGQHETLRNLAKTYFKSLKTGMNAIRRFNAIDATRLQRGQIVLVPMADLVLAESARAALSAANGEAPADGRVRERQAAIDAELPLLREHVRGGRYADAVQMANRLLGAGDLSARQIVTIERELGTALVALEREDLALEAFRAVLGEQPDYELDGVKTSPTVLRAFERARQSVMAVRGAGAPKAGPSPAAPTAPARPEQSPSADTSRVPAPGGAAAADSTETELRPETKAPPQTRGRQGGRWRRKR